MSAADTDLQRIASGFEAFITNPQPEHLDLFEPEIVFWRSHFPGGGERERTLDMKATLDQTTKLPKPQAANVRTFVHAGGDSFTATFDVWPAAWGADHDLRIPVCCILSVANGRITKMAEYVDAAHDEEIVRFAAHKLPALLRKG